MKKVLLIVAIIALVFMLGVKCFAAEQFPSVEGLAGEEYPYVVVLSHYSFDDDEWYTRFVASIEPLVENVNGGYPYYESTSGFVSSTLNSDNNTWGTPYVSNQSGAWMSDEAEVTIIATNYDIYTIDGGKSISKNFDYSPVKPLDIYGDVGTVSNKIGNVLSILVPVGIGIAAIFVGVSLVPRIVHKFF